VLLLVLLQVLVRLQVLLLERHSPIYEQMPGLRN
jgi:hypothetical protein